MNKHTIKPPRIAARILEFIIQKDIQYGAMGDLEEQFSVEAERFDEPAEVALYRSLAAAEAEQRRAGSVDDFLNSFLPMIPTINRFFDQVLVMSDDQLQRQNRLGLLQRIAALADEVADMSKLEGF